MSKFLSNVPLLKEDKIQTSIYTDKRKKTEIDNLIDKIIKKHKK
jgi:hypothetical protein